MTQPHGDEAKRLGRAIVFVHQHDQKITNPLARAEVEILLLTGRAMDFAARLKGHQSLVALTHDLVCQYAKYAGLGGLELTTTVLPALKKADLIDYTSDSQGRIARLDEFVGVSATVTEQTVQLLKTLSPRRSDLAFPPLGRNRSHRTPGAEPAPGGDRQARLHRAGGRGSPESRQGRPPQPHGEIR